MASYVLTIIGYPVSDSTGAFEWRIAGAQGQHCAAGRGTIAGSSNAAALAVERLTYHALLAGCAGVVAQAQAAFPDAPALQAVVLRRSSAAGAVYLGGACA